MSLDKIKKITASVLDSLNDSSELILSRLASKAKNGYEANPGDMTLQSLASILSRRADQASFISRGEFKRLYHHFHSANSKAKEIFAEELGIESAPIKKTASQIQSQNFNGYSNTELNPYETVGNDVLKTALDSMFENKGGKFYSGKLATAAQKDLSDRLSRAGMDSRVDIADGTQDVILLVAHVNTPKGFTSFYVPVEVIEEKVITPSVFLTDAGLMDFGNKQIIAFVSQNPGRGLIAKSSTVMGLLKQASKGHGISNVEMAAAKLRSESGPMQSYASDSITGLEVQPIQADVQVPQIQDPEISSFAELFDTPAGRAQFKFGGKVARIRNELVSELNQLGFKKVQAKITDCGEDEITFAVSVDNTSFMLPVRVSTETAPVMFCGGTVQEFSPENITALMKRNVKDFAAAAVTSPLYEIKASELVTTVREAVLEKNFAKAEDALNVLASGNDTKAYESAMVVYMKGLGNKTASEETHRCSRVVKTASSSFDVCGHTGLPLHKVYQDQNGDCHPMYRRAQSESYEGASFMNHKIFF